MAIALILSGGNGTRLGADIPKQYIEVYNRPIISYCVERLSCHEGIGGIQIVAAPQWREAIQECLKKYDGDKKFRGFSAPGENRQLSIYNGLTDIRRYADDSDIVLVHDAARPLLSAQMITDCLNAIQGHDGVVPVLPMKDTVYQSTNGKKINALVRRSEIYAGQAPEAFRIGAYYEANRRLCPDKILTINGSTEPAVMAGMDVVMIPGDEGNFKITTAEDLKRFREIIKTNRRTACK
ncbi:MAG: 2-C-methyl-D-erythritol 4-phosphate cytidylyltransferase [Lachnospiraceae bacterium]|nr:2-C-methyl-D-erythritol 4-phosphate cytidylyltransferase [Lachnospiraceae bacterium]